MKFITKIEADKMNMENLTNYATAFDSLSKTTNHDDDFNKHFNWLKVYYNKRCSKTILDCLSSDDEKFRTERDHADFKLFNHPHPPQQNQSIDGQFLPLPYKEFLENENLLKKLPNQTTLLLILIKNVVNWKKHEKLNLYENYFIKRNLLAASISRATLAKMMGMSKRRITDWLKSLEQDGFLKIERITCAEDDDRRHKYNVYILGEVDEYGDKKFYYAN